ncbi:MAG: hypothetical protein CXT73_04815 [Methanobacteriota archaeon]|nr:MAG: hypothetical protein CXT73_04815 [Euryarchaeota archaeon]
MSPMSKSMWIFTFLLFATKCVATNDDDDTGGEIAVDLMIGVGMAICEEFVMCKLFMIMMGFACAIMVLIGLCSGEISCEDICNRRNARRSFTSGVGYGVTRSFRR